MEGVNRSNQSIRCVNRNFGSILIYINYLLNTSQLFLVTALQNSSSTKTEIIRLYGATTILQRNN